jgi:hypothetical protein
MGQDGHQLLCDDYRLLYVYQTDNNEEIPQIAITDLSV